MASCHIFPREELNTIRHEELILLYALIKKRKVSPVQMMLQYWVTVPSMKNVVFRLLHGLHG